mgnify:FL=1
MTKSLSSQLASGIEDFAIHINRETIEAWTNMDEIADQEEYLIIGKDGKEYKEMRFVMIDKQNDDGTITQVHKTHHLGISAILYGESVAEYVFRVAFSEQARSLIVAKKEQGSGELKEAVKFAMANGMSKRQLAEMLKGLVNKQ